MKVAILGAGAFGTALGGILADNGYDIDYYDSSVERERLSDVLEKAKYIVLSVPSKATPYVLPYLPKKIPLIVATKGILTDVAFRDFDDWMVLSGPGFASDIKARRMTHLTTTDKRIPEMFKADYMFFDETEDKRGVLMCGALKNVYALLAGFKHLSPGTKEHETFLKDAAAEMKKILAANNAEAGTVDLYCGIGDLRLTCAPESRNFAFGWSLKENPDYQPECTVEGLSAIKRIHRKEISVPNGMHLIKEVLEVL